MLNDGEIWLSRVKIARPIQIHVPIQVISIQPPYPKWYDSNAQCDYHAGRVRHLTENCLALKRKVQSLINAEWLSFKKADEKPNVNQNPLPNHENPKVNVVDDLVEKCKNEVHEIMMPTEALFEEPPRKVLLDILNKAHVGHDISMEKFSEIIGSITSSNSMVFTDDEIPPEGLGHTKALHIQVKCKDYVITRVLVDNESTLNIMPKSTLSNLPVDMSHKIKYYGCESF
ncbi:uncharacterized protein E5676_scaffold37G00720 [Cucumis melo var. makuwa]|uniref:Gag-pro-like protein n=1 Tax=Cucumis melo var. makuwa TaxID=1194695 RepID=A0A5D3BGU3_CUCMM|nr:uncharacterized protein E5676_scaffold37G00720 [Cucumis melo var. makuwa]